MIFDFTPHPPTGGAEGGVLPKVQAASTQQHVPIAAVRNGIIILKDGSYRLILSVSPINFALKSDQEQNSIIFKYQSFLNSLHFPIQITMQSKKLDLTPYLQKMKKMVAKQTNELIRVQTEDYIDFVGQLINIANIMSKSFFITLSYVPLSLPKVSFIDKFLGKNAQNNVLRINDEDFKSHSEELLQRGNQLASALGSIGLRVKQLTTQEILEMFYNLYNPEEAGKERLIDVKDMQSSVVIDKNEAIAAHSEAHDDEEAPQIDNSASVEAAEKQKVQMPEHQGEPSQAHQPGSAQSGLRPAGQNAPAQPKAQEEAPPIKQRLETTQNPTPGGQSPAPRAAPATPASNQPAGQSPLGGAQIPNHAPAGQSPLGGGADQQLSDDNYNLK